MNLELLQLLVYGGPGMVLLCVVVIWYLPYRDKRHAETIRRIHQEDHASTDRKLDLMTAQTRSLARAVLIASLTGQGKSLAEAEVEARRIIANGP